LGPNYGSPFFRFAFSICDFFTCSPYDFSFAMLCLFPSPIPCVTFFSLPAISPKFSSAGQPIPPFLFLPRSFVFPPSGAVPFSWFQGDPPLSKVRPGPFVFPSSLFFLPPQSLFCVQMLLATFPSPRLCLFLLKRLKPLPERTKDFSLLLHVDTGLVIFFYVRDFAFSPFLSDPFFHVSWTSLYVAIHRIISQLSNCFLPESESPLRFFLDILMSCISPFRLNHFVSIYGPPPDYAFLVLHARPRAPPPGVLSDNFSFVGLIARLSRIVV